MDNALRGIGSGGIGDESLYGLGRRAPQGGITISDCTIDVMKASEAEILTTLSCADTGVEPLKASKIKIET